MNTKAYSALLCLKKDYPLNVLLEPEMISEWVPQDILKKSKKGLRELGINDNEVTLGNSALSTTMIYAKNFIDSLKKAKAIRKDFESIEIDFLRNYHLNAITLFVKEDNSYAIGLDPSLKSTFQQILLATIRAQSSISKNRTNQHIKEELYRLLSTIDVVIKVNLSIGIVPVSTVRNQLLKLMESTKEYWGRTEDISQFFINFVIAHELGHIELGHLNDETSGLSLASFDTNVRVTNLNMEKEYQADEWGWKSLLEWLKDYPEDQPYAMEAPSIYFTISSIIEKYGPPKTKLGEYIQRTHPPASKRAERLRYLSKNRVANQQNSTVNYFRSISNLLSKVSQHAILINS